MIPVRLGPLPLLLARREVSMTALVPLRQAHSPAVQRTSATKATPAAGAKRLVQGLVKSVRAELGFRFCRGGECGLECE